MGSLTALGRSDPPTQEEQQQYAAAKARYAKAVAGKLGDTRASYSAYPDQHSSKCYYAEDHDSADLCAQWRAAIAAEKAADSAWAAVCLGIVGTVLSGLGLAGLLWSIRQGQHGLVEARTANAIAEGSAKLQLRAYIDIENPKIIRNKSRDHEGFVCMGFQTHVYNKGATPAYIERREFIVSPNEWAPGFWPYKDQAGSIAPGDSMTYNDHFFVTPDQWTSIKSGAISLRISTQVDFRDVFDELHTFRAIWQTDEGKLANLIAGSKHTD